MDYAVEQEKLLKESEELKKKKITIWTIFDVLVLQFKLLEIEKNLSGDFARINKYWSK